MVIKVNFCCKYQNYKSRIDSSFDCILMFKLQCDWFENGVRELQFVQIWRTGLFLRFNVRWINSHPSSQNDEVYQKERFHMSLHFEIKPQWISHPSYPERKQSYNHLLLESPTRPKYFSWCSIRVWLFRDHSIGRISENFKGHSCHWKNHSYKVPRK